MIKPSRRHLVRASRIGLTINVDDKQKEVITSTLLFVIVMEIYV